MNHESRLQSYAEVSLGFQMGFVPPALNPLQYAEVPRTSWKAQVARWLYRLAAWLEPKNAQPAVQGGGC